MSSSRRIIIKSFGTPDQIDIVSEEIPTPANNEVLVKIHSAALNRADLMQRRGFYPPPPGYKAMHLGLEYAGIIVDVGADIKNRQAGDRVMGLIPGGAQADHIVVPADETIEVPDSANIIEAGAFPEVYFTAFDALILQAQTGAGDWCLIRGATSGVGIAACQIAAAFAINAIGTSRSADAITLIKSWGATAALLDDDSLVSNVADLTNDKFVSSIVDLVGANTLQSSLESLSLHGKIICVGLLGGPEANFESLTLLKKRASIIGTVMRSRPKQERRSLVEQVEARLIPLYKSQQLKPVIDKVFPADDVVSAHHYMEADNHTGKIVLDFS